MVLDTVGYHRTKMNSYSLQKLFLSFCVVPLRGEQDMGASLKSKTAQAETCCCPCESQPQESITGVSDMSGSVAALIGSADVSGGNWHLMKYLKSQFAHLVSVLSKSLITAPQAEGI